MSIKLAMKKRTSLTTITTRSKTVFNFNLITQLWSKMTLTTKHKINWMYRANEKILFVQFLENDFWVFLWDLCQKPKKGAESSDYCIHEPQFHDNTKLCSWTSHWVPESSCLRNLTCQVLTSISKSKFMQVSQRLKKVMATEQSPTKL